MTSPGSAVTTVSRDRDTSTDGQENRRENGQRITLGSALVTDADSSRPSPLLHLLVLLVLGETDALTLGTYAS